VAADRDADGHSQPSAFTGGRLGYASFQVIAKRIAPGEYALELTPPSGLQGDVFAWRPGGIRDLLWPIRPPRSRRTLRSTRQRRGHTRCWRRPTPVPGRTCMGM
jgi:hypothetical protein